MKNKKGYAGVELGLIIASLAILIGLTIILYFNSMDRLNKAVATQTANKAIKEYYAYSTNQKIEDIESIKFSKYMVIIVEKGKQDYQFSVTENGTLENFKKVSFDNKTEKLNIEKSEKDCIDIEMYEKEYEIYDCYIFCK